MVPSRGPLSDKQRPAESRSHLTPAGVSNAAPLECASACWLPPMYGGIRIVAQGTEAGFEAERIRCHAIEIEENGKPAVCGQFSVLDDGSAAAGGLRRIR